MAASNRKHEQKSKYLEDELASRRAEQDARRNYEFDARKRLYEVCEPLLFQIFELSDDALQRIFGLARSARGGYLGTDTG